MADDCGNEPKRRKKVFADLGGSSNVVFTTSDANPPEQDAHPYHLPEKTITHRLGTTWLYVNAESSDTILATFDAEDGIRQSAVIIASGNFLRDAAHGEAPHWFSTA